MNWFYALKDTPPVGPVDETTLDGLLRAGTITPETLVWREGTANWVPYSSLLSPQASYAPTGLAPAFNSLRCAECGRDFPPDQLISLAGHSVCASCKPIAVQKFQEGVLNFGAPVDAEELWARVQRKGFDFTISSVLSRSWDLVKGNFWPCFGVTLLSYVIMMAAGQIPLLGILALLFVQPQMMAGLYWYFLKQFRGEEATLNDAFSGFRRGYGQQAIYMLIVTLIMIVVMLVFMVPMFIAIPIFSGSKSHFSTTATVLTICAVSIPLVLALWYFMLCWMLTPILIFEKGLSALDAMKLSRRVIHLRIWKVAGLMLAICLLSMVSLLALIVGVFFVLPVFFASLARLYEDAFGDEVR